MSKIWLSWSVQETLCKDFTPEEWAQFMARIDSDVDPTDLDSCYAILNSDPIAVDYLLNRSELSDPVAEITDLWEGE